MSACSFSLRKVFQVSSLRSNGRSLPRNQYGRSLWCRPLSSTPSNSSTESLYSELKLLSEEILRHDRLYYEGNPEIVDDDYDALVRRELEISRDHPDLLYQWQKESKLGIQATREGRVGSGLAAAAQQSKRVHLKPMLSLDNVVNEEQLTAWLGRVFKKIKDNNHTGSVTLVTEPKLDGLSLSLRYEMVPSKKNKTKNVYQLVWASTRGDGKQGQDVTHAVRRNGMLLPQIIQIPHDPPPSAVEVRGEVVFPKSLFQSFNDTTAFSNARNAASGILMRKEKEETEDQPNPQLCFYAYDMVAASDEVDNEDGSFFLHGIETRQLLADIGFQTPSPSTTTRLQQDWKEEDLRNLWRYYERLKAHREEPEESNRFEDKEWGDYDMDGCVHKVSEHSLRKTIGNSNRSPRWAVAHKFPPTTALTRMLDVVVQVGRTGALTPVAELDPVDIDGVTVRRATLHNFDHLQQTLKESSRIPKGSPVLVRRAGDVIPQVVQRVMADNKTLSGTDGTDVICDWISLLPPKECPACGSPVVLESTANSTSGQVLRCAGPPLLCPPRAVNALVHAYSRDALYVKGLSGARIQQLMDANILKRPGDVFEVARNKTKLDEIAELPGWGSKSAQNVADSANQVASDGVSLARFIYSLGVRHSGIHSSSLIATVYGTVDAFLKDLLEACHIAEGEESFERLAVDNDANKGIGPVLIASLNAFSKERELVLAAEHLAKLIRVLPAEPVSAQVRGSKSTFKPLEGIKVVFTGAIPGMTRIQAKQLALSMGAKSSPNTVSKDTDLVVSAPGATGKKLTKATELDIKVISPEEFLALVAGKNGR